MPQLYMILKIIFKIIFAAVRSLTAVGGGAHCAGSTSMGELAQRCVRGALSPLPEGEGANYGVLPSLAGTICHHGGCRAGSGSTLPQLAQVRSARLALNASSACFRWVSISWQSNSR